MPKRSFKIVPAAFSNIFIYFCSDSAASLSAAKPLFFLHNSTISSISSLWNSDITTFLFFLCSHAWYQHRDNCSISFVYNEISVSGKVTSLSLYFRVKYSDISLSSLILQIKCLIGHLHSYSIFLFTAQKGSSFSKTFNASSGLSESITGLIQSPISEL